MRNPLRDPDNRPIQLVKRRAAAVLTRDTIGRALDHAFSGVLPSGGVKIDTRNDAVAASSKAELFFGLYEGAEKRLVKRHLRPSETLIELGTSIGFLGSIALQHARHPSRYIGVEANPALIDLARENLLRNAPTSEVIVTHGAIAYEVPSGTSVRFEATAQHTGARISRIDSAETFIAPAITLSDILRANNVFDYSLLADIEGAEAGLLLEDGEAFKNCQQAVLELHDTEFRGQRYNIAELTASAVSLGFRVEASYGSVITLTR